MAEINLTRLSEWPLSDDVIALLIIALVAILVLATLSPWLISRHRNRRLREAEEKQFEEAVNAAEQAGDWEAALALYRHAEKRDPAVWKEGSHQLLIASACMQAGATNEALARTRSVVWTSIDAAIFPGLVDGLCTAALTMHAADFYPEAERLLRLELAGIPNRPTIQGTLGSVLYELGRENEAQPLLQEVHDTSVEPMDLGISAAYLSAIWDKCGDPVRALDYRNRALKHLPDHPIVRRVLRLS